MLFGDQAQGFTRGEGIEGGAEVPIPLLHVFLSLPQIENKKQEVRAESGEAPRFSHLMLSAERRGLSE